MRLCSLYLIVALFILSSAGTAFASESPCPNGTMKVLVAPFWNEGSAKSAFAAYSFGLANEVSEAFENDPCIVPINGPLVLTEDLAALYTPQGKLKDHRALDAYARSVGATHVLTGEFSGQTWKWMLSVRLHVITDDPSAVRVGAKTIGNCDLMEEFTNSSGRAYRDISMRRIHAMLAEGVQDAFASFATGNGEGVFPLVVDRSGTSVLRAYRIPYPTAATLKAIATPGTSQAYAFLKLSRAYARYFAFDLPAKRQFDALKTWKAKAKYLERRRKWMADGGHKFTALGLSATAVSVDPKYAAARRFHAYLLEQADKPAKARLHYEAAIGSRPDDERSLMALGRIELAFKNVQVAKKYFARAAAVEPLDAEPKYMLGLAAKALGDTGLAIASFIGARNVMSSHVDARRELAMLYSAVHQDIDAATEYGAIMRHRPDADTAFKHAASLRAAGRLNGAERRLDDYSIEFPKEPRFKRFRGDVLAALGRIDEARASYAAAAAADPKDRRSQAMAAGASTTLLGGKALLDAAAEAVAVTLQIDERRANYQYALHDAILDLHSNGEAACVDGRGVSSALLATQEGEAHAALGRRINELVSSIRSALKAGEDKSLTTDEWDGVASLFVSSSASRRDTVEMEGEYKRTFLPLYRRHKCHKYDGEVRPATVAQVRARNSGRTVKRTEPGWLPKPMPFSPQIAPVIARVVRFTVDNTRNSGDIRVSLDGTFLGTVAKGKSATFNARVGVHRICIVQEGGDCADEGAEHADYLREGWIIKIRS